jgi:hypothetical protein
MRSYRVLCAFVLAAALAPVTTRTAMAWKNRAECVEFYKAEAGSKNLVCDNKKGNAHQECVDGVAAWLAKSVAGCPDK